MNRAKDTIVRSFNGNEEKYNRYYRMGVRERIFCAFIVAWVFL